MFLFSAELSRCQLKQANKDGFSDVIAFLFLLFNHTYHRYIPLWLCPWCFFSLLYVSSTVRFTPFHDTTPSFDASPSLTSFIRQKIKFKNWRSPHSTDTEQGIGFLPCCWRLQQQYAWHIPVYLSIHPGQGISFTFSPFEKACILVHQSTKLCTTSILYGDESSTCTFSVEKEKKRKEKNKGGASYGRKFWSWSKLLCDKRRGGWIVIVHGHSLIV